MTTVVRERVVRRDLLGARRRRGAIAVEYLVAILAASVLAGIGVRLVAPLVVQEYLRRQAILYSVHP